jgi:hypothetical protein
MRLRPANIRLINRRKSYLDRYPLYLRKANDPCSPTSKSTARINKGIDSSLHIRNFKHEDRETSEIPAAQPGSRSAGERQSHKARMYVSEESHGGIVPMNHSNKDENPSAESGEGRTPIKENARQPNTHPTQSEKRVSQGLGGVVQRC